MTVREKTKEVRIGDRIIGGGHPILIQSMTNTKTEDVEATVSHPLYGSHGGSGLGGKGDQKADLDSAGGRYPF